MSVAVELPFLDSVVAFCIKALQHAMRTVRIPRVCILRDLSFVLRPYSIVKTTIRGQ